MSPLVFLALALALSIVGSLLVLVWSRWPRRGDDGISSFAREMQALAPEHPVQPARPPLAGVQPPPDPDGRPRTPDPGASVRITSRSEE